MMSTIEHLEARSLFAAGAIDPSFTPVARNIALPRFDPAYAEARDVAIDAAGRTVVFGNMTDIVTGRAMMYVARFSTGGSADLSFGEFGIRVLDLASGQDARHIAIDDAGRIDLAYDTKQPTGAMMAVSQLDKFGVFNRRFGRNGVAFPRFGPQSLVADLTTDRQNNLVFVANAANQIGVGKFSNSGRAHPDFGAKSVRFIPSTTGGYGSAVAIDSSNSIFVGATLPSRTVSDLAAIKLTPTGTVDGSFGRKGYVAIDPSGARDQLDSLIIDSYGRLVLSGKSAYGKHAIAAAARYTANGTIDSTFFRRGFATGAMWAQNASEVQSFTTDFDQPDVQLLDAIGAYRLFMDDAQVTISYGGRRHESIGSTLPYDPVYINRSSAKSDFAAATARDGLMAVVAKGHRPDDLYPGSSDALFGMVFRHSEHTASLEPDGFWALQYSQVHGLPGVMTNGSLIMTMRDLRTSSHIRYTASGVRDMSFGANGSVSSSASDGPMYPVRVIAHSGGRYRVEYSGETFNGDAIGFVLDEHASNGAFLSSSTSGSEWNGPTDIGPRDTFLFRLDGLYSGAGFTSEGGTLFRINEGMIRQPYGDDRVTRAVPVQGSADGFVQGTFPDHFGGSVNVLARMHPDGTLDPTFGGGNVSEFDGTAIWGLPDGSLLCTYQGYQGLRRFRADGQGWDESFGVNGSMGADFTNAKYDIDNAGRIIAWRELQGGVADGDVQIARFTADGQIDTTFGGGDGIVAVDTHINSQGVTNVMIDAQNRLIVTSVKQSRTSVSWSATRLQA